MTKSSNFAPVILGVKTVISRGGEDDDTNAYA